MTDTDDDMFAGMIAEALGPNAREVTREPIGQRALASNLRSNLCGCGSGQLGYNLFSHTRELLMYCCHACEKPRRALLKDVGERLTEDG
jgi:hypothetical protein